jgi:FkbM family methyltransferase
MKPARDIIHETPLHRVRHCKHGTFAYIPHDIYIGRAMDLYGEYSEREVQFVSALLRKGSVVIECGANIGCHTIPMARIVGQEGRIIAFEPQRFIHSFLCANVALNDMHNITVERAGVGGERKTMGVPSLDYSQRGNFGGCQLLPSSPELVSVAPIDDIEITSLDLIKMDIEGMEFEALLGAQRTIARLRPMVVLEGSHEQEAEKLIDLLFEWDYELYWHFPPMFNPDNYAQRIENHYLNIISIDFAAFPKEKKVKVKGLRKVESKDEQWREVLDEIAKEAT